MTDYPTQPDCTIKAGDRVRSYDFPGRTDCYVEGIVEDVVTPRLTGYESYKILIQFRCISGERVPKLRPDYVYPPVNGTASVFGGPCRGVVRVPE